MISGGAERSIITTRIHYTTTLPLWTDVLPIDCQLGRLSIGKSSTNEIPLLTIELKDIGIMIIQCL